MNDRIPPLDIEATEEGGFLLEQDYSGNVDRIELHPTQVRYLAELAGLVPRRGENYTPPTSILARRLRVLHDRINELDERLRIVSNYGRDDLDDELEFSMATWELATEFCADLPPREPTQAQAAPQPATKPRANPDETQRVPAGSEQLTLEP